MSLIGGSRITRGNVEAAIQSQINNLLAEFDGIVEERANEAKLRGAVVRSRLSCNTLVVLDQFRIFIAGERAGGMPSTVYLDHSGVAFNARAIQESAVLDLGFQDPFVLSFSRSLLETSAEERRGELDAVAMLWIDEEVRRVMRTSQLVHVSPLFGPADYVPNPNLCFVLMPFRAELDQIYRTVVQPCIEAEGLLCRRADEIVGNSAIMQDVWQSICEARIVVADLTGRNPNVFYELGIAHTVGKDTILLAQREEEKLPFDVAHIRTIVYEDTAAGGQRLRESLAKTIQGLLNPIAR